MNTINPTRPDQPTRRRYVTYVALLAQLPDSTDPTGKGLGASLGLTDAQVAEDLPLVKSQLPKVKGMTGLQALELGLSRVKAGSTESDPVGTDRASRARMIDYVGRLATAPFESARAIGESLGLSDAEVESDFRLVRSRITRADVGSDRNPATEPSGRALLEQGLSGVR